MDIVTGILWLLLILSVLVVAHEWGHFIIAKLFRMRVEEFSLFFGPILVHLGTRNETEYNIRSIPLGGFVKIAGMEADDISGGRPILEAIRNPASRDDDLDSMLKRLKLDTMANIKAENISPEFRNTLRNAIDENGQLTESGSQELHTMRSASKLNSDEIMLLDMALNADRKTRDTGLYSNKPLYQRALVIFAGPFMSLFFGYLLFCFMGVTLGLPSPDHSTNQVQVIPGGAAQKAGMLTGDRILSINGVLTPDGEALKNIIHNAPGKPLTLLLNREGHDLTMVITPRLQTVTIHLKTGVQTLHIGLIGVMPNPIMVRSDLKDSLVKGTIGTYNTVIQLVESIFSKEVKENVGGPIAMGQMSIALQRLGAARMIEMAGMLSLSLGVMNLLPIPILDGGHLMLLGIEKLRRRKLTPREIYRAQMVGLGLLGLIICMVMYNDLLRTFSGHGFQ
jgi:regulator of sigma E protease